MVQPMSKQDFLAKVFNYEEKSEWQFQGDLPCVIDFHADWCPPCKAISPIVDELSKVYAEKVVFYKVNTENEKTLMEELGIDGLPCVVFCPLDDKPIITKGATTVEKFSSIIDEELLARKSTERE